MHALLDCDSNSRSPQGCAVTLLHELVRVGMVTGMSAGLPSSKLRFDWYHSLLMLSTSVKVDQMARMIGSELSQQSALLRWEYETSLAKLVQRFVPELANVALCDPDVAEATNLEWSTKQLGWLLEGAFISRLTLFRTMVLKLPPLQL